MIYKKIFTTLLLIGAFSLITACKPKQVPVSEGGYYYSNIYFGKNFTPTYKKGIKEGCITAKGTYTKSHYLFNNDNDYNKGWFLGRNRCKDLLIIDEK